MATIFESPHGTAGGEAAGEKSRLRTWVDSNIGATIAGKYEVVRCLGTGGMGGVFLARHELLLGSYFALKLIIPRPHSGPTDELEKRFMREARTAMKFVHPRAAQVRDFGFDRDRGVMYMAMDFLDGRRLDQVLADAVASNAPGRAVLDQARALRITYLILDVLLAAHAADVIHRDLKPGNIIITGSGAAEDVRILDFGCAKMVNAANRREPVQLPGERTRFLTDTITEKGIVMGTVQYMAPEQARGEKLDGRADLYSAGVVLYEMLTGRIPHESRKHNQLILARALKPVMPLAQVRPDVSFPPLVRATVDRALAMKREDRFADAAEFARAVEDALNDTKAAARAESGPRRVADSREGRPPAPTVALHAAVPGAATRASRVLDAARRLTSATVVGAALIAIAWLGWTRVGYSLFIERGEGALARGDFASALDSFERARELRPGAPLARELASRALAEKALSGAEQKARLGDLQGLRLELGRADKLGTGGARLQALKRIVSAATRVAEARRLASVGQLARARGLLDLVPDDLSEPWATRVATQKSSVDAEIGAAARLLRDAQKLATRGDPEALAMASAALTEFLKRFLDHPCRTEAVLLRARVKTKIAVAATGGEPAPE